MKAPLTYTNIQLSAVGLLITLVSLVYPHSGAAQTINENTQSLVFEMKPSALSLITQKQSLNVQDLANAELAEAVQKYLESKKSPLAPYADQIILEPNWEQALGITFVESNFCARAANLNCGSVGVKPGHSQWRKFENHFQGFQAVTKLLDKPLYKNKYNTCKKKMGVYVVPGSANWLRGCEKVEREMAAIQETVNQKYAIKPAHQELALAK